jgi:hypothetical protein
MDQLFLFNEAEDGVDEKSLEAKGQDKITVPSYTRKKHGRKRLSEDIPRKEVIHDLDDDEKQCPCCGKDLPHIGEEVTEELDIIPQQIIVNKHISNLWLGCMGEQQNLFCDQPVMLYYLPEKHRKMLRYYGIYANNVQKKLDQIEKNSWPKAIEHSFNKQPEKCPECNQQMLHDTVFSSLADKEIHKIMKTHDLVNGYFTPKKKKIRAP